MLMRNTAALVALVALGIAAFAGTVSAAGSHHSSTAVHVTANVNCQSVMYAGHHAYCWYTIVNHGLMINTPVYVMADIDIDHHLGNYTPQTLRVAVPLSGSNHPWSRNKLSVFWPIKALRQGAYVFMIRFDVPSMKQLARSNPRGPHTACVDGAVYGDSSAKVVLYRTRSPWERCFPIEEW